MSDIEKEYCSRCQIDTLNGKRGGQLITNCDKFSWCILKVVADAHTGLTDFTGFME